MKPGAFSFCHKLCKKTVKRKYCRVMRPPLIIISADKNSCFADGLYGISPCKNLISTAANGAYIIPVELSHKMPNASYKVNSCMSYSHSYTVYTA